MNPILQNKVALVTGASRGIGRTTALALARASATVILSARDKTALNEIAQSISETEGQAHCVPADLRNEQSIDNLVKTIKAKFNRLDILVNNAGIAVPRPLEQTTNQDWDCCMAVNARAAFILCRDFTPLLRQAQPGYIINISSVVGVKGYPNQIAYGASKHALRGMSIAMAEELKADNIRVHVLCPGGVNTNLVKKMRPDIKEQDLMNPEEIAEIILYLVTHQGNAVIDEIHLRRQTSSPWF